MRRFLLLLASSAVVLSACGNTVTYTFNVTTKPDPQETPPDTMSVVVQGKGLPEEGVLILEQMESPFHVIDPTTFPKNHPEILGMITTYYPGVSTDIKFEREGDRLNILRREAPEEEDLDCAALPWEKLTSVPFSPEATLRLKHNEEMYSFDVTACSHLLQAQE